MYFAFLRKENSFPCSISMFVLLSFLFPVFKCSHSHAKEIFLSSFTHSCAGIMETKPNAFWDTIKSWFSKDGSSGTDVYGIHNKGMSGIFELKTSASEPYCKKM